MSKLSISAALAALLSLAPSSTSAGGFAAARFGGELGNPTTAHPTAIYFNPAGLALDSGTRIYAEGVFVYRTASYERPVEAIDNVLEPGEMGSGTPQDAIGANAGEATLSNVLASPFAAVVSDLGVEGLGVGLGLYVPFGGSASWDKAEEWADDPMYPGAVDGVQRWSSVDSSLRVLYLTAAGAYRINDQVSVGAGVNVVSQAVTTTRARTASSTDDLISTATGQVVEGRSFIDASSTQLALSAGVMWRPIERLRLGASYQSQPGFGENTLSGTLSSKFGAGADSDTEIELVQSFPDVFRLGASYLATPQVEVRVSADYTRWSVTEYQCLLDANDPAANCSFNDDGSVAADGAGVIVNIPRDWNDTFGVRVGGSWFASRDLEVMGGLSYDSSATPDQTADATAIDMDKIVGSAGVRWATGPMQIIAALTQVYYVEREVPTRGAVAPVAPEIPSLSPDGGGTYNQAITLLNLGLQYAF